MFLSAPELFTCCTDVNICIRANWYVCNVLWYMSMSWVHLFSFYHYIHCAYSFSDSPVSSGMFLVARAAKWRSFVFTCSWEHVSNALPQPIIWRAGDVNSDLLQITCGLLQGCTSNKEQNIITWLQASVLHLRRERDWKHLCKLSWNILLSFQCGGGDFFYFFPSGCSCVVYWKLLGCLHILARKNYFVVVKCCLISKSLAAISMAQPEMEPKMGKNHAQKSRVMAELKAWAKTPRQGSARPSHRCFCTGWVRDCSDRRIQESCCGSLCFSFLLSA